MHIHQCFDETLKKYAITGAALARQVGISPSHISQFRNGKGGGVTHTTLEDMLGAMEQLAPGSKLYFCLRLAGTEPVNLSQSSCNELTSLVLSDSTKLRNFMATASAVEKAYLMNMIVNSFVEKAGRADSVEISDSPALLRAAS